MTILGVAVLARPPSLWRQTLPSLEVDTPLQADRPFGDPLPLWSVKINLLIIIAEPVLWVLSTLSFYTSEDL